jgi:hypothetical protein
MGLIVEFTGARKTPVLHVAKRPILVRSLNNLQITDLNHSFEKYYQQGMWQGYAILDNIPELLNKTVQPSSPDKRIGTALFSSASGDPFFLFNELQGPFHLLGSDGEIMATKKHLKKLLKAFHKNILN